MAILHTRIPEVVPFPSLMSQPRLIKPRLNKFATIAAALLISSASAYAAPNVPTDLTVLSQEEDIVTIDALIERLENEIHEVITKFYSLPPETEKKDLLARLRDLNIQLSDAITRKKELALNPPPPQTEPEVVVQPDPEPDPEPIIEEEEEEEIVVQPDPEPIEEEEEEIVTQPDPDPEPIIIEEEEEPVAAARKEEEEEKPVAAAREEITIIEEPEPSEEIEEPVTLAGTGPAQEAVREPVLSYPPARSYGRYGKLDVTWPHGLNTINLNDSEGIVFSIAGNESVTRGYTRFSCRGNARCEVQILRIGHWFDITSEGNVTASLNTESYVEIGGGKANVAYDALKFSDGETFYGAAGLTWQRRSNPTTVRFNSKTVPFSSDIETRHGWAGKKYKLTDGGKTYEAYFYVDSNVPLYSFYGYWMTKDSTGNLERARGFAGYGGSSRNLPNLGNLTSGTATYVGDAVGQYALKGSILDSGSFTATATLTADFSTDKIKGTIDNFSGPFNGSSWSIELKEASFENQQGTVDAGETVWTIDGVEGDSGGVWDGEMFKTDSGFPRDVVGGFSSEHSGANAVIVGGFGAEKQ